MNEIDVTYFTYIAIIHYQYLNCVFKVDWSSHCNIYIILYYERGKTTEEDVWSRISSIWARLFVTLKKMSGPEQRLKFDGNIRDVDLQFFEKDAAQTLRLQQLLNSFCVNILDSFGY